MTNRLCALLAVVMLCTLPAAAAPPDGEPDEGAGAEADEPLPAGMTAGPAKVKLGPNAEIDVPEGTVHGNAVIAKSMLEKSGNLTSGREVGILLNGEATVLFEFDDVGYVKDDDKDALDADKMLTSMRENQEEANKELVRLGRPELELPRWQVKPHYDEASHNLEWGPIVRNKQNGHETVNYNVRLLGRRGVMEVALLVAPEKLDAQLPWFRETMKNYSFVAGEDYASWKSGDKVAEYGLAALVTGGVVAAAAKSGLLAKLWKLILVGLAALGAGIKKLFGGGDKVSSPTATASNPPDSNDSGGPTAA